MNRKQYILETQERQNITEISVMDGIHMGLDVLGMTPVVGAVADLTNAGLYAARGKKGMAALSLGAAIPGVGQAATAGKYLSKIPGLSKAAKALSPTAAATAKATKAATKAKNLSKSADAAYATSKTAKTLGTATAAKAAKGQVTTAGKAAAVATKGVSKRATKAAKAVVSTKKAAAAKRLASRQASKAVGKAALRGRVIGTAGKAATRAGVLARGNVADTFGFDTGGKPAKDVQVGIPFGVVKGEGQALVDKTVSGIMDTLAKAPGAARDAMKKLDDYKLGSFQS